MQNEQSVLRAARRRVDRNALITFSSAAVVGGVGGIILLLSNLHSVAWAALASIVCLGVGMLRDHLSWRRFRAAYKRAENAPNLVGQMHLVSGSDIEIDEFGFVRSIKPNACGLVENVNTSRWHFVENGQIRPEPIDKAEQRHYAGGDCITVVPERTDGHPTVYHSSHPVQSMNGSRSGNT